MFLLNFIVIAIVLYFSLPNTLYKFSSPGDDIKPYEFWKAEWWPGKGPMLDIKSATSADKYYLITNAFVALVLSLVVNLILMILP